MKKLSLMIMLLMWFNIIAPAVQAADDEMADLEALMGALEEDTGDTTEEDTGDTMEEDTTEEDDMMEDDTTEDKVVIEATSVSENSATLLLHPVDGYTTYKVYYNKEGDDNVAEKEVVTEEGNQGTEEVELTGLEPATTYTIVAKAFDEEGNPIESTTSDPITVRTNEATHQAPADNVIYNPTVKAYDDKIVVSYKPGMDVKKIQISISEDGNTFKPVAVVDSTTTTYTIPVDKAGKKYVKLVPVAEDGTLWVCKIGATDVQFVTAEVPAPTKEAEKNVGKPKTGPETYLLVIFAVLAYVVYARRKNA